jgi:hypothetical protein
LQLDSRNTSEDNARCLNFPALMDSNRIPLPRPFHSGASGFFEWFKTVSPRGYRLLGENHVFRAQR